MAESSMSALWTLGRGVLAAPSGALPRSAPRWLSAWRSLGAGRSAVRRRPWPWPFQNRLYSTRDGIYWRTARKTTPQTTKSQLTQHLSMRMNTCINSQHPNTLRRATAWETSLRDRRSQDAFIDLELRAQEPTTSLRPSNRCQSRTIP